MEIYSLTVQRARTPGSSGWQGRADFFWNPSLPGLYMALLSLCPHMVFPVCVWVLFLVLWWHESDFIGLALVTSFHLNYFVKDPISIHIRRYWGLELQHLNFGGHDSAHNINQIRLLFKVSVQIHSTRKPFPNFSYEFYADSLCSQNTSRTE